MSEEEKTEQSPIQPDNGKIPDYPKEPSDFKIAEIWIKKGQLIIEAPAQWWQDPIRSLGILEWCKDIVKNPKPQKKEENKVIPFSGGVMNFVRNGFRKRK